MTAGGGSRASKSSQLKLRAYAIGPQLPCKGKPAYCPHARFFQQKTDAGIVPVDAEFPDPDDSPVIEDHLFKAPKPWDALDDVMQAIEGDDSPASYFAASLLRRELREFGARWHGLDWAHTLCLGHRSMARRSDRRGRSDGGAKLKFGTVAMV